MTKTAKKAKKAKPAVKQAARAKKTKTKSKSAPVIVGTAKISKRNGKFHLEVDAATAKKFDKLLSEESLIHAGLVAHESNNVNIPEVPEHSAEG